MGIETLPPTETNMLLKELKEDILEIKMDVKDFNRYMMKNEKRVTTLEIKSWAFFGALGVVFVVLGYIVFG